MIFENPGVAKVRCIEIPHSFNAKSWGFALEECIYLILQQNDHKLQTPSSEQIAETFGS